ncbi:MAG: class I SAM-dependent methyltransferase [Desulfuromonadales bacterium]|nr:class I SAM-dependent methyltransferase [Desulfuromonadales bacterium]
MFWHCHGCDLIFVDAQGRPTLQREKDIYQHHQNSPEHHGYVTFLRRIIDPTLPLLNPTMRGLDFGCGPGPTLSVLLKREDISCDNYDPLFFPALPSGPFDFIFATECFEHFHTPTRELQQLRQLLKPDGYLFVMTSLWHENIDLPTWRYLCDPTHVSFYHRRTFEHICRVYGFTLLACDDDRILLLQKKQPTG